ncbi:MAG: sodium:calcium antiporter [Anaerolineae bacterium]|jgi:cation:H+ antiporter|nr:sodium:calcium antiporter [Anaerolineae bacterium]MDH7473194.1 sodium:calcium antiporter [Anaerolineae bacterium]
MPVVMGYGLLFVLGLALLERGADLFTDQVGELAERTGVSETVIGLLTAGIEWEETLVVVLAALRGSVGIAVGDVIGSNIANLSGSFAVGLLARPVNITKDDRRYSWLMLAVTVLVSALLWWQGGVSRATGGMLVTLFAIYLASLLISLRLGVLQVRLEQDEEGGREKKQSIALLFLLALGGLALIILGAEAVIRSAVYFAAWLHVSEFVIGLTLVAVGTTLPDNVIAIAGALKGRSGIVTANAIGSNICNLLLPLGIAALVRPLSVDTATLAFDLPVLVGLTALVTLFFNRPRLGRGTGALLLSLYVLYLLYNFVLK